jgi:hypothetical protein
LRDGRRNRCHAVTPAQLGILSQHLRRVFSTAYTDDFIAQDRYAKKVSAATSYDEIVGALIPQSYFKQSQNLYLTLAGAVGIISTS